MEVDKEEFPLNVYQNTSIKVVTLNFVTIFDQDPKWVRRFSLKTQNMNQVLLEKIVGATPIN